MSQAARKHSGTPITPSVTNAAHRIAVTSVDKFSAAERRERDSLLAAIRAGAGHVIDAAYVSGAQAAAGCGIPEMDTAALRRVAADVRRRLKSHRAAQHRRAAVIDTVAASLGGNLDSAGRRMLAEAFGRLL